MFSNLTYNITLIEKTLGVSHELPGRPSAKAEQNAPESGVVVSVFFNSLVARLKRIPLVVDSAANPKLSEKTIVVTLCTFTPLSKSTSSHTHCCPFSSV